MNGVTRQHTALPVTQRGVVVLLLLLILAVSTASYFLVKRLNGNAINIERDKITAAALAQAKAALIGYAAADKNRPGELICPDVDNDGKIDIPDLDGSDCRSLIGRLPWHSLRLPDLRDGYGERLWYALSNNFHANGSTPLNNSILGQLTITGDYPANAVVAIVFSPGPAIGNQIRDGSSMNSNVNNILNYFEGENAILDNTYESGNSSNIFNDKLLPITHNDLFSVVEKRILVELVGGLRTFYANHEHYPWAGDSSGNQVTNSLTGPIPYTDLSLPSWFTANGWPSLVSYAVSTNFQPGTIYPQQCGSNGAGCLSVNGYNQSQAAVTIGSHSAIVCMINSVVTSCP